MTLLIGLDLGTTNAKAVAYTLEGETVAQASAAYPAFYPQPGRAEQRPADWTAALSRVLRELMISLGERKRELVGIGLSAHGPGLVLVDANGSLLTDTCATWQDERFIPQGQRLLDAVGPEWLGLGMPMSGFPARLLWMIEEQAEVAANATYALGVKDYLVGWLTGHFATEPSSGPGRADWWSLVFEGIDWPLERLAPVLPSTATAGAIRHDLAQELDLVPGLPVIMGLNDGASATLASAMTRANDVMVTIATNGVVRMVCSEPVSAYDRLDYALFCWPYVDDLWITGGFAKCGASALDWFARLLTDQPPDVEPLLAEAGNSVPGSRGVTFIPYLIGRGSPHANPTAQGGFLGLTLMHQRGDLVRAVLEGVAFALREILEHFEQVETNIRRVHISGGGARSPVWRQIMADVLGCSLQYYAGDSTLGAAIAASVGLGLHPDFQSAVHAMTRALEENTPVNAGHYDDLYLEFQRVRDRVYLPNGNAPDTIYRVPTTNRGGI
jgi:xylulokinase